jgi:hypothetical protein
VSVSYVGFIVLIGACLLRTFTPFSAADDDAGSANIIINIVTLVAATAITVVAVCQSAPVHYLVYFWGPPVVWNLALKDVIKLRLFCPNWEQIFQFFVVLACLEFTVAAFFYRECLSVVIVAVALLQFRLSSSGSRLWLRTAWLGLNLCLCAFTFQPSIGKERNVNLVLLAGVISALASLVLLKMTKHPIRRWAQQLLIYLTLSGVCVYLSSYSEAPMTVVHIASWIIFATGVPIGLAMTPPRVVARLLAMSMALQAAYILLSLSYEGLFLFFLIATLGIWVRMEYDDSAVRHHQERNSTSLSAFLRTKCNVNSHTKSGLRDSLSVRAWTAY